MYIIIIGHGTTAEHLAKVLIEDNNDVVIVIEDETRAEVLAGELDALVIKGDATTGNTLEEAGINKADALAIMTEDDSKNMMISQLAEKFDAKRIVSRVSDPEKEALFLKAGVDAVISPTDAIVEEFRNVIRSNAGKSPVTFAGGKVEIFEVSVPDDSNFIGKRVSECRVSDDMAIVCIGRGKEILFPKGTSVIRKGDILTVAALGKTAEDVLKKMSKKA